MSSSKEIFVYWDHFDGKKKDPELLGILCAQAIRGKEIFSFEWDVSWKNCNGSVIAV